MNSNARPKSACSAAPAELVTPVRGFPSVRALAAFALPLWIALGAGAAEALVTLGTATAAFTLDTSGSLTSVRCPADGPELIAPGQPAPLLSLRIAGRIQAPTRATWDAASSQATLHFEPARATARVEARRAASHVRFELVGLGSQEPVELVLWGPYPTSLRGTVGETVGVIRDARTAFGIQTLNSRTLGGYPTHENDIEAEFGMDDPGTYPDLPPELAKGQHFRGDTARPTDFGGQLQAFCRQRDRERVLPNWGHERFVAPPYPDGGVVGSRIALFAVPAAEALATLGAIEVAEGLPHPTVDGVWTKMDPRASASYLIVDFGESTIERAVEMTRRAGLGHLYHSSPFETWGHFRLKPALFPNGRSGLKTCVDKARAAGVQIGVHTLSNFITPNDPYVTPTPDPRLARIGTDPLVTDVTAEATEIPIGDPTWFRKPTAMNTVVIGSELIRYKGVSETAPWRLVGCQRGAWGTRPSVHAKGDGVGRLMDHDYRVFLTDATLAIEVARQIAALCNETGIRQLSFDGLEGNWSTGMGQYGRTLFTHAWYDALSPELRGHVLNDASNPGHFNWHVYTRMNWGEPWYAGFRESQTLYRFKNQLYFERNLMPRMLGWFALRPDTTLEDAEWLLARAAGFDAGFALAASLASTAQLEADPAAAETTRQHGAVPAILEAVRHWETARLAGGFPPELRAALRDNTREFHLASEAPRRWRLHEVHAARFSPDTNAPAATHTATFRNPHPVQAAHWTLRNASKSPLAGLRLQLDGRSVLDLGETAVPPGGGIRYDGGADAALCDAAWKETRRLPVAPEAARLDPGEHRVSVTAAADAASAWRLEIRTMGPGTPVAATR